MKRLLLAFILLIAMGSTAQSQRRETVIGSDSTTVPVIVLPSLVPMMGDYDQPLIYIKWWMELMECSKLVVPKERLIGVHFKFVGSPIFTFEDAPPGDYFLGYAEWQRSIIWISWNNILKEPVVKHEMLHYLEAQYGLQGHLSVYGVCHVPTEG